MQIQVLTNEKTNRGLYRIFYTNGYIYVGSFVNKVDHVIGETYFGSSKIALKYGWRKEPLVQNKEYNKSQIDKIEIRYLTEQDKHQQSLLESEWIKETASEYGIADCARVLDRYNFSIDYKHGRVINLHANDCLHLQTSECRRKAENTKRLNGSSGKAVEVRYQDIEKFKESSRKSVETKKNKYGFIISDSCRKANIKYLKEHPDVEFGNRMVDYHEKSVNSRKLNNSYKTGSKKVAKTISGRDHFVAKSIKFLDLNSLQELYFNSIKEAEEYFDNIGIHITRATISQGLLRTNGSYIYKNKFKFSY